MTHIFNEEVKISHIDESEIPINVVLPGAEGLDEKELLTEILTELKKINLHLSLMTGETIKEADL